MADLSSDDIHPGYVELARVELGDDTFIKYRWEDSYDLWWVNDYEVWYDGERLFGALNEIERLQVQLAQYRERFARESRE